MFQDLIGHQVQGRTCWIRILCSTRDSLEAQRRAAQVVAITALCLQNDSTSAKRTTIPHYLGALEVMRGVQFLNLLLPSLVRSACESWRSRKMEQTHCPHGLRAGVKLILGRVRSNTC